MTRADMTVNDLIARIIRLSPDNQMSLLRKAGIYDAVADRLVIRFIKNEHSNIDVWNFIVGGLTVGQIQVLIDAIENYAP